MQSCCGKTGLYFSMEPQREIHKNTTVYNFDYSGVDGKPELLLECLKILVGERGFEPPTPWSRTRFTRLLKIVEFVGLQLIAIEPFAGRR